MGYPLWAVRRLATARAQIVHLYFLPPRFESSIEAIRWVESPGMFGNFSVCQHNFHPSSMGNLAFTFLIRHSLTLDTFTKIK